MNPGNQIMVSRGLNMKTGKWKITEPKRCGCCNAPSVFLDMDSPRWRVMSCDECSAVEYVQKPKDAPQWFYHGARLPHEWPAQFIERVYAD